MVLCSMETSRGPSPISMNQPLPPSVVDTPVKRFWRMAMSLACCDGWPLSYPSRLMPAETFLTRLCSNRTCSTTHHVHAPLELRGVKTIAYPGCDSFQ